MPADLPGGPPSRPPLPNPLTLPALLHRNRDLVPLRPAIVADDGALTHAGLDERSRELAGRLVAAGVGKASRVGLMAPNGLPWVVIAVAVMRLGAVLVPLSTLLKRPELAAQLEVAGVSHLVVAREFRGRRYPEEVASIAGALPLLRHVWTLDAVPTPTVDAALVAALEAEVRPADDLVVLFTSGSRGAPKGIIHTHGGGLRATASGLDARCVYGDERLYIPMPLFLDRRLCQRSDVDPDRRRDPAHRSNPRAGSHAQHAGA